MLVLNECRVSEDGKYLIIEASVDSFNYYDNVYIKHLIIDTDETWSCNGPSTKPVYEKEFELHDTMVSSVCGPIVVEQEVNNCCDKVVLPEKQGMRRIRLKLSAKDLNLSTLNNNIYFVYVIAGGYPRPDTPCGMDNSTIMGVALNLRPLYNYAMGYIKSMGTSCEIPKGFVDSFLKFKALQLALKTGNYPVAFQMWKYLMKGGAVPSLPSKGCGCHGNK